ncbi:unnamed protein product, partial [Mesorhabditis spiculigera]
MKCCKVRCFRGQDSEPEDDDDDWSNAYEMAAMLPKKPSQLSMLPKKASQLFTELFVSEIVSEEQSTQLMMSLPPRFQFSTPQLAYRLTSDGTSLKRFWSKIDDAQQSILIIRSTAGDVFGAYCSASWATRKEGLQGHSKYFGTGETFVFRIDDKDLSGMPIVYNWTGYYRAGAPELFMTATDDLLIVGSGDGDAIRISSELSQGYSSHCTTFNSPPLVKNQLFVIEELEVFSVATT